MKPYNTLRALIFLAPAFGVLLTFSGCHKKNTKPDPGLQKIFTQGCTCVGNTVYFSFSSIQSTYNAAIVWDFGDGTASSSVDHHVYNASGTYTVTVFVDGYSIAQNFYINPSVPQSPLTWKMQGVRHWVGRFSGNFLSAGGMAVDTQMALTVPDAGTIIVRPFLIGSASYGKRTLSLASIDTVGKVLTFWDCSYLPVWVRYFYDVDSIFYQNSVQSKSGHLYENDFLHTVK